MADVIDLQAKNDHDLLVMLVMQSNETVRHLELMNSTLKNHEKRLRDVETPDGDCNPKPAKRSNLSKAKTIGISSGLFIFGGFIGGIINALANAWGWW